MFELYHEESTGVKQNSLAQGSGFQQWREKCLRCAQLVGMICSPIDMENFGRPPGRKLTELVKPHDERLLRQFGQRVGTLTDSQIFGTVKVYLRHSILRLKYEGNAGRFWPVA